MCGYGSRRLHGRCRVSKHRQTVKPKADVSHSCELEKYVNKYIPQAAPYIRGDRLPDRDNWVWSSDFDGLSIMNYGSYQNSDDPNADFPEGAVLVGRDDNGDAYEIYQGGDPDPSKAGPSTLDLERVGGLYNKDIHLATPPK